MKKGFNILLMMCAVLFVLSCSNQKSFTDMLNAEKKAVKHLLEDSGFVVLKDYPKDGKFKANEFYKREDEIYIQVVDSGNGERAEARQTILARFSANRFTLDSTEYLTRISNYRVGGTYPVEFFYGYTTVNAQKAPTSYQSALESFMSEGLAVGLEYVGNGGVVKMIVPFKKGSEYDMNQGNPVFFEIIEYKFD
ncbi:hypothetical protein M2480_002673 [Parabacteroides sp. PFB2-12]|uniref:DUF4827 family protein n=1 Tax=unclassified Parabacteroides TaxID=2649774 RepID=UPI002476BF41|nr:MULTISPECIES: DUF4827 family protein [unclassified Parabacteroides]MDH6343968.1 hypothetical protein [Parabacteroides sp. PM6-13]MDH6391671.1 hypothetical protein [Parabacteroides sp. PFB2-12]